MEILLLLDFLGTMTEEEKEKAIDEEFRRQKSYVDALCNLKREEVKK